jgi:single-strand DNA-binding protein
MATLNKVMLIGRLTKDPEAPRVLPNSGSTVVKFRFAVGRSKKNDAGGWDKDPNQLYIDCEVFSRPDSKRNLADLITKYAKQGEMMYIEGRLVFEEWEDRKTNPPQKRSKHKLVVDSLEFLGGRGNTGGDEGGGMGAGSSGGARQMSGGRSGGGSPPPTDDGGDDDHGGGSGGGDGDPIPF